MAEILKPKHETLNIAGEISYSEDREAWNLIRLKHDLLKEFPQLKEKRSKFSYEMIFGRTKAEIIKAMKKITEDKTLMPISMFLHKD